MKASSHEVCVNVSFSGNYSAYLDSLAMDTGFPRQVLLATLQSSCSSQHPKDTAFRGFLGLRFPRAQRREQLGCPSLQMM